MREKRCIIQWLGYCEPTNKVWGWFTLSENKSRYKPEEVYCFWAVKGKTISMNKHKIWSNKSMDSMIKAKKNNGYTDISVDTMLETWSTMLTEMDEILTFLKLSEKI